ncbi:SMP-30/gluconolactonase/LRE family protein [Nocardia wallacei]|uniref:SMP-30/gluconolactonase/LRE family protein n=1 Tax=Nocardia wallacei TaxID=480035 RepID=UPI0024581C7A|nr:superoxide dismutase [Nocardia wallacei]
MKARFVVSIVLVVLGVGIPAPAPTAAADTLPTVIELPAGFRPEGIAIGKLPEAFVGSMADGSVYRVDLTTGRGAILSRGPGTPALGLGLDDRGKLFVAGGPAGDARIVDTRTGTVLATYQLGTPPETFVNDVAFTSTGAWFTDSRSPVLYHLPLDTDGTLPAPTAVERIRLTGDIAYAPDEFNANGIVAAPAGTGLIIVQSATGRLFHVDPETGTTHGIDLGSESVPDGDGLLITGDTLYVVQNRFDTIAEIALHRGGLTGTLLRRLTDPHLEQPSTIATHAGRFYLPNTRFATPPEPTTPYTVAVLD